MKIWVVCLLAAGISIGCDKKDSGPGTARGGKKEKIISLLETTGSLNIGKQMSSAMLTQIISLWQQGGMKVDPAVLERFKTRFAEEVDKDWEVSGELVGHIVELYAKYYTEENIDDMDRFYRTETGKKVIQSMPALMAESMAVGQKWGQERGLVIAKEIIGEIKEEGHEIPNI